MKRWWIHSSTMYLGDCLHVMRSLPPSSVDSIITDPPYGLGFMGKNWDHGIPGTPFWNGALRVAKPGAFLLAFGGTRTFHRLTCAIEDAGWEIRDCVMWMYGQGFPKSLDISRAIDKKKKAHRRLGGASTTINQIQKPSARAMRARKVNPDIEGHVPTYLPATDEAKEWKGYGTSLKPAWEPIIVAMKPTDGNFAENALKHGVAGINVDECRVGTTVEPWPKSCSYAPGRFQPGGKGRKMMANGPMPPGRFPANLIHDGSEEVVGMFPKTISGITVRRNGAGGGSLCSKLPPSEDVGYADSGSAARFFYCAKASKHERGKGNAHPTVKPLSLMRYLCRLVRTPTGGIVLDPFAGSGTTGLACILENRPFIGIEKEEEYYEIAKSRIRNAWEKMTHAE